MRNSTNQTSARLIFAVLANAGVAACSSSIVVEGDFPAALVEPLPVRMGLILDRELTNYEHHEEVPQQATWTVQLGSANAAMFTRLFESMFLKAEAVDDVPLGPGDEFLLDGVLRPELERFEFEVPIGQKDEFVEVWLQYILRLYEPDGAVIAEWPVSGYGKAELGQKEAALNRATIVAMRDVGAAISTTFSERPRVGYWLQERSR